MYEWVLKDADGNILSTPSPRAEDGTVTFEPGQILEYDPVPIFENGDWTDHGREAFLPVRLGGKMSDERAAELLGGTVEEHRAFREAVEEAARDARGQE